ncbi:UNVERIFIED_CONTAM: hypothetical protein HDU68_007735 [Siphonaria sp. JEL0065]|nr:hypothetical protein HDU68_007735 [Siphonaria sp. JEL0065]
MPMSARASLLISLVLAVNAIGLKPEWKRDPYLHDALRADLPIVTLDSSKRDIEPVDPACKTHTYTPLLTDCQYLIMIKLTSFFETAKPDLDFGVCSTTNDGQGISAGFIQFTTCQGAVMKVCEDYTVLVGNKTTTFCTKYLEKSVNQTKSILESAIGLGDCASTGQVTPPGLESFCTEWQQAATIPLFQQAQLQVQHDAYFEPIETYVQEFGGFKSPLVISQYFDTSVQLGPLAVEKIGQNATSRIQTPLSSTNESIWLQNYLDARQDYLSSLGGAYSETTYRLDTFRSMLKPDNSYLNFTDSIHFICWNTPTTLTPFSPPKMNMASVYVPHNLTTILEVAEQDLIIFAAYIMMQGIFLGMSCIFLYQAVELYKPRRSWLTFANIIQLLLWIARTLIIIVFNIAPYFMVDCTWRQYAAGFVSQAVIICVWWLQYIKFQSMYKNRPWVCRGVLAACVVCSAATFPYIQTTLKPPALDHCAVAFNSIAQSAYISADVFINVLLSALFGIAIMKHVNNTDKSWDSYSKLSYILGCDVRGSFLDTAAQLVKLFLQLATWLPSSQTQFGSHVCDFIKVLSAHWFVNDVVKNSGEGAGGTPSHSKKAGNNSKQDVSTLRGSKSNILASAPYGSKEKVAGSSDTINFQPFLLKVMANEAGGRPLSRSTESLRAEAAAVGSPGLRVAKSSDNVKK